LSTMLMRDEKNVSTSSSAKDALSSSSGSRGSALILLKGTGTSLAEPRFVPSSVRTLWTWFGIEGSVLGFGL
jgi:hypothetical protein